jgi:hypothetical protein
MGRCVFLYIKLFDIQWNSISCSIYQYINTIGVYLVLGYMLHSRKLIIHSGSSQFLYDLKDYRGHVFAFDISFVMKNVVCGSF